MIWNTRILKNLMEKENIFSRGKLSFSKVLFPLLFFVSSHFFLLKSIVLHFNSYFSRAAVAEVEASKKMHQQQAQKKREWGKNAGVRLYSRPCRRIKIKSESEKNSTFFRVLKVCFWRCLTFFAESKLRTNVF